jgi:acylphosphatase
MSKVRAELKVHGRVQGVFYRQSTKDTALQLGLTGWAKNCQDGSVEAVFEGDKGSVDAAIEWCRQGPPAAHVTEVAVIWQEFQDEFSGFGIRS